MSEMLCAGGIPYRVIIPVNCDGTPVGGPIYVNLTTGAVVFVAPVSQLRLVLRSRRLAVR
jgi:hypothetical protein